MTPVVTPPMRKGKVPPFYDLGEMPFQEFCRDLLDDLGHYKDCRIFGIRGQKQYGIDIRCIKNNGGLDVVQCKCYKDFTDDDIEQASNDFVPYVEDWLSKGVKRFILIVACPVETTQAIDQMDIETKRLEEFGIQYELWDAVKLRYFLRDLPKVVRTHIHPADHWVKELCGDQYMSAYDSKNSYGVNLVTNTLINDLNQLSALLTSKASQELEDKRELFRRGKIVEVIEWINKLRDNETEWLAISPETRGSILRLEAIIDIDCYENYSKAEQLLQEAKEIDPSGPDQRIWALWSLHTQGPQVALDVINSAQDVDSKCLQASLLLQLGRYKEAISLLESLQVHDNAEVFRLLALAYLDDRNLENARETINRAKEINNQWESVQIADAVISYFSALSPVVLRDTHFVWPAPVGLELVKSTNESLFALDHAAVIFKKIAHNEERRGALRLSLRVWYAACLACDFRKQIEAEKEFADLILENPADHRLISWIFYRGYALSLESSRQELKRLRKNGSINSAIIVSSVMLDIQEKRTRNTLHLIESSRKKLIEEENEQLVDYWAIQVLVARKMLIQARKRLDTSKYKEELEPLHLLLLEQEARTSKDFQPFIDYLTRSIDTNQDSLLLLELCHFYSLRQQWNLIAPHSEKLVSEIQTVEALKIASASLFNLGRFLDCKVFLEKYKHLCFENNLPGDLALIYIRCKAFSGEFPEALSDLRQLAENNPTKQKLLLLRDFYILKGDKSGLRDVVSLVKKQADFKPDELISLASSLLWASPELAKELFRMAPSDQLGSQQIIEKMTLGFSLGLDNEMKDIHSLLPQIMGKKDAPIKMMSLEETIEILKERNQHWNELVSQYLSGELPIHLLTKNGGSNLFSLYKKAFLTNNNGLVPQNQKFPLYIRYGGEPSLVGFKEPDVPFALDRISLDITTLLLLDHFSLLNVFERVDAPILLPGETIFALVNMKQALEQHQPEVIQAMKLLMEYLNEKRINEIDSELTQTSSDYEYDHLLNFARGIGSLKGYVVGFSSHIDVWKKLDINKSNLIFITLADVVDSMRVEGIITEVQKVNIVDQLGTEGLIRTSTNISPGSNLFFEANSISQLAQTEIFSQVCDSFITWIENSEVLSIQSSLREERDRLAFAASLQNLIDRLSRGIEDKKYAFLPHQGLAESDAESLAQDDILLRNLKENFLAGQNNNILSTIDDLFIQRQLHNQGVHVIGIFELVWSAYKQNLIDATKYYDLLIEFRKSDLRYIPISGEEIFFHIKQAGIDNNNILESANLRVLKGYISTSLTTGRKLKTPTQPFDSIEAIGEFEYVISLVHSIANSVIKIWQDSATEEQKQTRSSWIFENLYLDILTLCHITGWEREPKDHVFLVALGLAEFFLNGLQFQKDNSDNSPREQFYDWFYRIICEPRFKANPGLLERTAEFIKNSLASQITEKANSDFEPYIRLLSERFYQDLPNPIKEIINTDKKFLGQIGIEIISVIEVAGFKFAAKDFWKKLAQVLEGHPMPIWSLDPKVEILFSPYDAKGNSGVTFVNPNNGGNINVESEDFVFILNANWQVWLDNNSDYFTELSKNELAAIISQICLANSPAERMERLNDLRKSSIGNYYHNLREELKTTQALNFGHLLPPSRQSLRQFFGVDSNNNTAISTEELINQSAKDLKNRLGLFTAVSRVAAFPIGISTFLVDEIKKLSTEERDIIFSKLSTTLVTPICRLHLIKVAMQFGHEDQITKSVQSFFTEDVNTEISAFLLLLGWVSDAFDRLPGDECFSLEEKLLLSWGHTNELFSIFKQVSIPFDWLIDVIKEKKSQLPFRYIFSSPPLEWTDVVYAGKLDALPFKILGLNYAIGGSNTLGKKEQEVLLKEVFPWKENIALPAIDLLEQRESFTNVLLSFLGKDIPDSLLSLTSSEGERISTITSSSLGNLASQAIDWLSSPDSSIAGFQFLFGIYHTQALPEALLSKFEKNISAFKFVELINQNPMVAILGFYFSTCQAKQLSDSAKTHLIDELLELAEVGSKLSRELNISTDHNFQEAEIIALLFESTIQLSKTVPEDEMIDEFGRLTMEIISRWKEAKTIGLRLLNRLYQDIPIPVAHTLGKVLLEVRSLR